LSLALSIFRLPTYSSFFFFNDTATTEIYTLSLHDALPIYGRNYVGWMKSTVGSMENRATNLVTYQDIERASVDYYATMRTLYLRSEEHTSELQSRRDLVCRLLLEKKKKKINK